MRTARSSIPSDRVGSSTAGFGDFYRANWADLVAYCTGLVGDHAVGEEVAQEAFVRLYPRWHSVRDARPYVFRIAANLCRRHFAYRRRTLLTGLLSAHGADALERDPTGRLVVEASVARLPRRLREVLLLHYYADMSVIEIATTLGRPSGTVKRNLHEARARLAHHLDALRNGSR